MAQERIVAPDRNTLGVAPQGHVTVLPSTWATVPFRTGERLDYDVKFGPLHVGKGSMEVIGVDTVRGREAWHTAFTVRGGTFFYHVNDKLESWLDVRSLSSLRHTQDLNEGSRDRERHFEIYPERGVYVEEGKEEQPTVDEPLDDGSFLYFLRTIPLEVGKTYEFSRYFRPDRNPVIIQVLRRERVSLPAGKFNAIVVRPYIPKGRGILAEKSETQMYLSDDPRRMMLALVSTFSFGTVTMRLKEYSVPGRP